jgi:2-polyprenyl-3-methyl-5-hydroxy-6-metoxy-1,4-benzoquinol methylase
VIGENSFGFEWKNYTNKVMIEELSMPLETSTVGYKWYNTNNTPIHSDLLPSIDQIIRTRNLPQDKRRIFDLGCGNGSVTAYYMNQGFDIVGVDPSKEGLQLARSNWSGLRVYEGSAYDDLAAQYGTFPVVISLEVVEHVYSPRDYAKTLYNLVEDNGVAILSTPYHGYWKNLALAITGSMDKHFTALWDHGHIKFWSMQTLTQLLEETGFQKIQFERVGRIPAVAKSMIAIAHK